MQSPGGKLRTAWETAEVRSDGRNHDGLSGGNGHRTSLPQIVGTGDQVEDHRPESRVVRFRRQSAGEVQGSGKLTPAKTVSLTLRHGRLPHLEVATHDSGAYFPQPPFHPPCPQFPPPQPENMVPSTVLPSRYSNMRFWPLRARV